MDKKDFFEDVNKENKKIASLIKEESDKTIIPDKMNSEELNGLLNKSNERKKQGKILKIGTIAACLALIVGVFNVTYNYITNDNNSGTFNVVVNEKNNESKSDNNESYSDIYDKLKNLQIANNAIYYGMKERNGLKTAKSESTNVADSSASSQSKSYNTNVQTQGVDEADIRKIISDRTDYPGVEIEGLQFYSGTQKKDLSQMKTELEHLDEFIGELKSESGFEAQVLEYGPGFFVPYFKKDKSEDVENILSEFRALLESLNFKGKVVLEMGRFLAAACGYYVTSIVDMKVNKEQPYVIMDGGINHLNYYGQAMAMKQPYCTQLDTDGNEKTGGEEESWNLCGALCTVSDVVVKRFPLHKPQLHDILVFERVGAYSVTEGIYLFLSRPLPRIYFWTEGEGLRMVRDGVHTDLLNSEK